MSPQFNSDTIRLALPKGRMFDQIVRLLADAGVEVKNSERDYRPYINLSGFTAKILKPRNVISMMLAGARDLGFAGADWVLETGAPLIELLDTGLNPVRLVAATPQSLLVHGKLPDRNLVVASEYTHLSERWIASRGLQATVLTTFGATEVFPPEDADVIVDNTATGSTLRANGLVILDEVLQSTTRLYTTAAALENPKINSAISDFVLLLRSVLEARSRVMMDLNVAQENLQNVIACLPSMKQPTVSALNSDGWYAIRSAVPRSELARVIPLLKAAGAVDIVTTRAEKIIP